MPTFTTDGPCDSTNHYVLPAATRLAEVRSLVDQGRYFVLRAPVRTGKTTALRALAAEITNEGGFAAIFCSARIAAAARSDMVLVQDALLSALRRAAEQDLPEELRPPPFAALSVAARLWESLAAWARVCPRPIAIFFDDLDSLHDAALESVLRQLEAGFSRRPGHFPWSIGLVSQFDLRRPRLSDTNESAMRMSTGPFASFWSSRLLPHFRSDEIRALFAQHFGNVEERFTAEALEFVKEASAGHPYFVQALGRELSAMALGSDNLTKAHVLRAYQRLSEKQDSPIEELSEILKEPRVRSVIEPLLSGKTSIASATDGDIEFVRDIGLVAADDPVRIDGALHRVLIARLLALPAMRAIVDDPAACFDGDGRLYLDTLLQSFGAFYELHAEELIAAMPYAKIAQELVFLGYLFKMLEGRGAIEIDYGRGKTRIELTMPLSSEMNPNEQREVLVLVSRRKGDSGVRARGLETLEAAMEKAGSDAGTLVVFDKRGKRAIGKRIKFREMATAQGKTVRSLRI